VHPGRRRIIKPVKPEVGRRYFLSSTIHAIALFALGAVAAWSDAAAAGPYYRFVAATGAALAVTTALAPLVHRSGRRHRHRWQ
jgi:hypothetical protein